jgi:hypothetical protein
MRCSATKSHGTVGSRRILGRLRVTWSIMFVAIVWCGQRPSGPRSGGSGDGHVIITARGPHHHRHRDAGRSPFQTPGAQSSAL